MGIEKAAQNIEREAMNNPKEAAASIKLLNESQQNKLFEQMRKDAAQDTLNGKFSVERDANKNVTAINFFSIFDGSTRLLEADQKAK
jgi:hypothetical protein